MADQNYAGGATEATLASTINASVDTFSVTDADDVANWPTANAVATLDKRTATNASATEEKVFYTARSGANFTGVTRGFDGTTAATHAAGVRVEHTVDAASLQRFQDHIEDASGAHAATAVSFSPTGNVAATNVQTAIAELDTEKSGTGHTHTAQTATTTAFTPAGNIAAATVQAAIEELDSEKSGTSHTHGGGVSEDRALIPGFVLSTSSATTATQMLRAAHDVSGAVMFAMPIVMDRAGSVVGLSASVGSVRTAGSLTFEVYKNGTGTGLTVAIDATHTQYYYAVQAAGADTFVAGDRLDVRLTNSSFTSAGVAYTEATITVAFS